MNRREVVVKKMFQTQSEKDLLKEAVGDQEMNRKKIH